MILKIVWKWKLEKLQIAEIAEIAESRKVGKIEISETIKFPEESTICSS